MTASKIRVPDSISIVGYDDIDFAAAAAVPLSSVRQPRHLLGRTAAQLLLDEALGEASHQHRQVVFEPELVIRQSSRPRQRHTRQGKTQRAAGHRDHDLAAHLTAPKS
jgi:LacI family transcriptional regulator